MFKITATAPLTPRGSITASVEPPAACALDNCLAELHLYGKYGEGLGRIHLDETNRRELIEALGGVVPAAGECAGGGSHGPHPHHGETCIDCTQCTTHNGHYGVAAEGGAE